MNGGSYMQPRKRAIILYRVSTDRQDLDAQKTRCRRFCKDNEFEIIDEIYEDGVSGYKNALKNRKEIVEIMERAEKNEYDALIVFMFDRLGRREDGVPFLIQHLANNDVDIYTANTGQKIETSSHTDKFMNYMQSWMAEFESIKTSERVKNVMEIKNGNGEYTGGTPPYGYEAYLTGEVKEGGKAKYDLRINDEEAEIVRLIFDLTTKDNLGGGGIARYLNSNGYKNRQRVVGKTGDGDTKLSSGIFRANSINRLIKNPIYIGRPRYNVTSQNREKGYDLNKSEDWKLKPYNPNLRIVNDDVFYKANEMSENRKVKKDQQISHPRNGKLLLSGIAYCGKCGTRLKSDYTIKKYKRKSDGKTTTTLTNRYICNLARNLSTEDHGKKYYSAKRYTQKVESIVFDFIDSIDTEKFSNEINKFRDKSILKIKKDIEELEAEKRQSLKAIDKFEIEIEKCLLEDDQTKMNVLIKGVKRNEDKLIKLKNDIENLKQQLDSNNSEMSDLINTQKELVNWKEIYESSEMGRKKMMIMELTDEVLFFDDGIEIKFKLPLENSTKTIGGENGCVLPTPCRTELGDLYSTKESNINTLKYAYLIVESKFEDNA